MQEKDKIINMNYSTNWKIIKEDYMMIKRIEEQFLKHCSSIIKKNADNAAIINSAHKTQKKFFNVKKIVYKAYKDRTTYRKVFDNKINKILLRSVKKSSFYAFIKELRKIWYFAQNFKTWRAHSFTFDNLLIQPTIPINPYRKYSIDEEKDIADSYYNYDLWIINRTNVWLSLRNQCDKYKNLSLSTVCKYINNDKRSLKVAKRSKTRHPLRKWEIDIGNIQLDIKVIGRKENKFNKYLYILDAKDEQSKLYWCKYLQYQTKEEILSGVNEMIRHFSGYGIKIKRIRTDNAMVFKKTNIVKTGEFDKILEQHNIVHEFIPLGQPECNGVIERHHRILDEEIIRNMWKCETIEDFVNMLKAYEYYFNNERYHYYSFKTNRKLDCYDIPINFLRKCLYVEAMKANKRIN